MLNFDKAYNNKEYLTKRDAHYIGFHFGLFSEGVLEKLIKYFPEWRIFKLKQYRGIDKPPTDVLFIIPPNFTKHTEDKKGLTSSHSYPSEYIQSTINAFEKQYKQRYDFSIENINCFVQIDFMYVQKDSVILQLGKYKSY